MYRGGKAKQVSAEWLSDSRIVKEDDETACFKPLIDTYEPICSHGPCVPPWHTLEVGLSLLVGTFSTVAFILTISSIKCCALTKSRGDKPTDHKLCTCKLNLDNYWIEWISCDRELSSSYLTAWGVEKRQKGLQSGLGGPPATMLAWTGLPCHHRRVYGGSNESLFTLVISSPWWLASPLTASVGLHPDLPFHMMPLSKKLPWHCNIEN